MSTSPSPALRHAKPIIGLAGGIGSGKSFIAGALASMGCGVINADLDAHAVLNEPEVKSQLTQWWGGGVLKSDGTVDRKKIAAIVFSDAAATARLNSVVHPRVAERRVARTQAMLADGAIRGIVWDAPLLFEVELHRECDAVIFVKAPYEQRVARVGKTRGWPAHELDRREKMQIPLDKKEKMADYVVDNSGEESASLRQLQRVFSQILSRTPPEK